MYLLCGNFTHDMSDNEQATRGPMSTTSCNPQRPSVIGLSLWQESRAYETKTVDGIHSRGLRDQSGQSSVIKSTLREYPRPMLA